MSLNNKVITKFVLFFMALAIVGCSSLVNTTQTEQPALPKVTEVNLINPLGPAVIPVAGIASQNIQGDITINIQYWKTVDEAIGLLSGDQVDFAVLPVTTGVNMAASGIDIVLVGVHEWKVFYLVAADSVDFTGWDSLVGKTVYSPEAKGQTVDVLTRFALLQEGIQPDEDVIFAYAPPQEIVALFKEGKIDFAALPEPYVTLALASGSGEMVLDYQDYWLEVSAAKNGIPIAGLFVRRDFFSAHPNETQIICQTISESTSWANENTAAAVESSAEILPIPAAVMQTALQRIKFDYKPASEIMKNVIDFLETMQETYPEGIKEIPDESFFAR
ncbi:MAG: ABC transporter substrate-binding protein [Anaerolineales bacterium]|nr:ABC transporter substrate-binding protein [Anaerolineales bacterium]